MPMRRLLFHSTFLFLIFMIILFPVVTFSNQITSAKYSFSSNFYIFVNIKPSVVNNFCHKHVSSNYVYYAIINPNRTMSVIKMNRSYIILNIKIKNVLIYTLTDKGRILDKCNTNLTFTIKYNRSNIIMPLYNHTPAGGFPYIGTKKNLNGTTVLLATIGTRDFEIETPEGMEKSKILVPGNVLEASPVIDNPENLSEVVQLFERVFSTIATVHARRESGNNYVINVIPNNASVIGVSPYGLILSSPPGRAYSYHNISIPASLVSSHGVGNLKPAIFTVGSYKSLYYDGIIYFYVHDMKKIYVMSVSIVPPIVPNGKLHLYDVNYRWDNGLLLNASFNAFLANAAVQGFILQGPILNSIAVDTAKYGVIYGIVPSSVDPGNFLSRLVSNPLSSVSVPSNAYFNVYLVEYNASNPQVTTVKASEGGRGLETTIVLAIISLLLIIIVFKKFLK